MAGTLIAGPCDIGSVPRIVSGTGTLDRLPGLVPANAASVMLVTDAGVDAAGLADRVTDVLAEGPPVTRFVAPAAEPTVPTVDRAAARVRDMESPVVVGLGGGTALDVAKLVAGLARTERDLDAFLLGRDDFPERAPAIMIPTTSGTGSEVTRTCIVSNPDGAKLWVWSPVLAPDSVLLDPELTASMPRALAVTTGLDAFVHALEAATGQAGNRFSEAHALQAIHLARTALEPAAAADARAAATMQQAATLAGLAIDSGGTGMAHNIGHALGSLHHVPHGVAVAIALQASLEWSVAGAGPRFERAATAFQPGASPADLPGAYAAWLGELDFAAAAAGALPASIDPDALARVMAQDENAPMAGNNARPGRAEDLAPLAAATAALCERYLHEQGVPA